MFRKVAVLLIVGLVIGLGCEDDNNQDDDLLKGLVCVKEDGEYTGEPKGTAVSLIALAIELGAGEFGVPVDHETANKIATEVLNKYCEGVIDDFFGGLDTQLKLNGFNSNQRKIIIKKLKVLNKKG